MSQAAYENMPKRGSLLGEYAVDDEAVRKGKKAPAVLGAPAKPMKNGDLF
jgi:hypothetical protein